MSLNGYDTVDLITAALNVELNDDKYLVAIAPATLPLITIRTSSQSIVIQPLYTREAEVSIGEIKRRLAAADTVTFTAADGESLTGKVIFYFVVGDQDTNKSDTGGTNLFRECAGEYQGGSSLMLCYSDDPQLAVKGIHEVIAPWNKTKSGQFMEPPERPFDIGGREFYKLFPFSEIPKSAARHSPEEEIYITIVGLDYYFNIT